MGSPLPSDEYWSQMEKPKHSEMKKLSQVSDGTGILGGGSGEVTGVSTSGVQWMRLTLGKPPS